MNEDTLDFSSITPEQMRQFRDQVNKLYPAVVSPQPMNDLDQKLKDIVQNPLYKIESSGKPGVRDGHAVHDVDGDVAAIKKCFEEAGYIKLGDLETRLTKAIDQLGKDIRLDHNCLSGNVFYDHFIKELHKPFGDEEVEQPYYQHDDQNYVYDKDHVEAAAKRAAGLSNE